MSRPLDGPAGWRLTVVLALLAAAGLAAGIRLFTAAFPEASIDFKLSRNAAAARAADILSRLGRDTEDYRQVIIFDYDDSAKTYLEREIGLERANELMRSEVNVWKWHFRRFRPLQKEEFHVHLDPSGRLVGYRHLVEEATPGAALDASQARQAALDFLSANATVALDQYTLVEEKAIERPARRDHVLTWERSGFRAAEATYRIEVTLLGDAVGGYREFLKIPEEWSRGFEELRSHNNLLQNLATVFFILLLLAMVAVLFVRMQRRQVRWRLPLILGGVMFGLQFVQGLNALPLSLIDFPTTESMGAFLAASLGLILVQAFGTALLVFLPVAAGEVLYREYFPSKLSLRHLFSGRATGTSEFLNGSLTGYLFVLVHFGFLTAFYYYGRNLGFWSPAEVNYTNAVSTVLPWITPLALSFNASLFEECTFRLFAIPFLKRYLKSTWLAILIPAVVWGFLHSAYPQQPSYVRGVEVGLIGVAAGWIMLRYGIWATLVWHYVVDAFLIGLFLFRSSSLYFQVSGTLVVGGLLIPALLAAGAWLRRRRFADASPWTNAADVDVVPHAAAEPGAAPAAAAIAAPPVVSRLPPAFDRRFAVLAAAAVLGLAVLGLVKMERFGEFAVYRIGADEASRLADAELQLKGVDPGSFKKTTNVVPLIDDIQSTYIYRQGGKELLNRVYATELPGLVWKTRYFRPQEKEEYWVSYRIDGQFYNYRHLMDEQAAGASLAREEALARAVSYLQQAKSLEVSDWKLVRSESNKRDQRTDYEFEWEREAGGIGEARFRVGVGVLGDEVQGFHRYLKVPEEWELKEKEQTFQRRILQLTPVILTVSLVLLGIVLFSVQMYRREIAWKRALRDTALVAPAIAILYVNALPSLMEQYPTQFQFRVFWATVSLAFLILLLLAAAGIFMLLGLARSQWRQLTGGEIPEGGTQRGRLLLYGVLAGYCLEPALAGASRLYAAALAALGIQPSSASLSAFLSAGELSPALGAAVRSYMAGAISLAALVCLAGLVWRGVATPGKRVVLLGAGLLLASGGDVRAPADFLIPLGANLLWLLLFLLLARISIGLNLAAFGTWLFVRTLAPESLEMWRQPEPFLALSGGAGLALVALPLLAGLWVYWRRKERPQLEVS